MSRDNDQKKRFRRVFASDYASPVHSGPVEPTSICFTLNQTFRRSVERIRQMTESIDTSSTFNQASEELQKESQFVNECFEDRALMDLLRLHWIDYFSHSSKRSLSTTQDNDGNTSPVTVTGNPLDKCLFEYDKSIGKHGISKFLSSSSKISSDRKSRYWKTMRRLTVLRNSLFNPAVTENLLSCMRSDNFIAKHTKIEQNLLAKPIPAQSRRKPVTPATGTQAAAIVPIEEPEILLDVAIYSTGRPRVKQQQFTVYGRQPLSALRDAIYCHSDYLSEEPNELAVIESAINNLNDPSFFFIEGQFYVDDRRCEVPVIDAQRYVSPILEWQNRLRQQDPQANLSQPIVNETPTSMHNTSWLDLPQLRLQWPYPFLHRHDCWHTLVIQDIRPFIRPLDSEQSTAEIINANSFPLQTFHWVAAEGIDTCEYCVIRARRITHGQPVRWVTVDDRTTASYPFSMFCDRCFRLVHNQPAASNSSPNYRIAFPYVGESPPVPF